MQHPALTPLSGDYSGVGGRLDTRYAPVRRSTPDKASFTVVSPRLACVKPVASVHPEPGSNSPLYIFFIFSLEFNPAVYRSCFFKELTFLELFTSHDI